MNNSLSVCFITQSYGLIERLIDDKINLGNRVLMTVFLDFLKRFNYI